MPLTPNPSRDRYTANLLRQKYPDITPADVAARLQATVDRCRAKLGDLADDLTDDELYAEMRRIGQDSLGTTLP
jgi:hypothetical protein